MAVYKLEKRMAMRNLARIVTSILLIVGCLSSCGNSPKTGGPDQETIAAVLAGQWDQVWSIIDRQGDHAGAVQQMLLDLAAQATNRGFTLRLSEPTGKDSSYYTAWKTFTDSLLAQHPEHPIALYLAGDAEARLQNLQRATDLFSDAIERDNNFALAYNARGAVGIAWQHPDQALSDLDQALVLDPNLARAHLQRGNIYRQRANYDRAEADYNRAIELCPDLTDAYNNRGEVYRRQDKYDQALADYNKAIEIDPNFCMAYNNRGLSLAKQGKYDQALKDYNEAIKLEPQLPSPYYNRGIAYYLLGQYDAAVASYQQALDLDPANYQILYNLASAADKAGKTDIAIQAYTKFKELAPPEHEPHKLRAQMRIDELTRNSQKGNTPSPKP